MSFATSSAFRASSSGRSFHHIIPRPECKRGITPCLRKRTETTLEFDSEKKVRTLELNFLGEVANRWRSVT